jgi:hypothetical protein
VAISFRAAVACYFPAQPIRFHPSDIRPKRLRAIGTSELVVLLQLTDPRQHVRFQPFVDEPFKHFNSRPLANEQLHAAHGANDVGFLLLGRSHVKRFNTDGAGKPSNSPINNHILRIFMYYDLDATTRQKVMYRQRNHIHTVKYKPVVPHIAMPKAI